VKTILKKPVVINKKQWKIQVSMMVWQVIAG